MIIINKNKSFHTSYIFIIDLIVVNKINCRKYISQLWGKKILFTNAVANTIFKIIFYPHNLEKKNCQ